MRLHYHVKLHIRVFLVKILMLEKQNKKFYVSTWFYLFRKMQLFGYDITL